MHLEYGNSYAHMLRRMAATKRGLNGPTQIPDRRCSLSTTISSLDCPQCGYQDAWFLHDCRTSEESLICPACGFIHESRILIDRRRSTLGNEIWKLDKAGYPIFRSSRKPGNGVVSVQYASAGGVLIAFKHPPTEEEIQRCLERIMTDDRIEEDTCYITRWDEATGTVIPVYGQIPPVRTTVPGGGEGDEVDFSPYLSDSDQENFSILGELPF